MAGLAYRKFKPPFSLSATISPAWHPASLATGQFARCVVQIPRSRRFFGLCVAPSGRAPGRSRSPCRGRATPRRESGRRCRSRPNDSTSSRIATRASRCRIARLTLGTQSAAESCGPLGPTRGLARSRFAPNSLSAFTLGGRQVGHRRRCMPPRTRGNISATSR